MREGVWEILIIEYSGIEYFHKECNEVWITSFQLFVYIL